jgi:hypothetical protein
LAIGASVRRLIWFAALWAAGVAVLAAVAIPLRWLLA